MDYNTETPRKDRKIGDFTVAVPQPFAEGQVMTAGQAAALNQTVSENVSNNLREKLKAGVTEGEGDNATTRPHTAEEAQALVDAYLVEYEMGVRREGGGRVVLDPVEREARKLAAAALVNLLKEKGLKRKDVDFDTLADGIYEKNVDSLTKAAKKLVAEQEKAKSATSELNVELDI